MEDKLIIYTTQFCVWCRVAKEFLKRNNISFEEKIVDSSEMYREELLARAKDMVVPVIQIGNETIIGFDRRRMEKVLGISEK